jgi:hypothetical protein
MYLRARLSRDLKESEGALLKEELAGLRPSSGSSLGHPGLAHAVYEPIVLTHITYIGLSDGLPER